MKLLAVLPAALFATVTTWSLAIHAADPAPATEVQTSKPVPKAMKPHSHMEEKTGVAAPAATPATGSPSGKTKADQDKSKHYHPRDAK